MGGSQKNATELMQWIPSHCDFQIKCLELVSLHQFSAEHLCIGQYIVFKNNICISTLIYSLLFCVEEIEAQVVLFYYVDTLSVVDYCCIVYTTVRSFTKGANCLKEVCCFHWVATATSTAVWIYGMLAWSVAWYILEKKVAVIGKFSALLMMELPASTTFNSLSRHFRRSDKDQFDDTCSLAMFFLISSGIFFKITGTSNVPYELSICSSNSRPLM